MRTLTLQRRVESADGTLGELLELGLRTIEEEDRGNQVGESRIPAGRYTCRRSWYHRGGYETFEVFVPGRSRILFHIANTEEDVSGCIGPGEDWGKLRVRDEETGELREKIAVVRSARAFARFMGELDGLDGFTLDVVDVDPALPAPRLQLVDSLELVNVRERVR